MESKAHVFDETFGVNRAFNAEVFVAAPHPVAMEFDLFRERRSGHSIAQSQARRRQLLFMYNAPHGKHILRFDWS